MKNRDQTPFFGREHAAVYDRQFEKVAAINGALHLLARLVLAELPAEARVLCVGAGTGAELLALAEAFPHWHFTALEPSAPMLEVCRRKAQERGIAARCTFHQGYIDSLPVPSADEAFDAATAFLVSQFLLERQRRRDFFGAIAERLRPGGWLVSSDLAREGEDYDRLFPVWLEMLRFCGMTPQAEQVRASHGRDVAVSAPREVEAIIASGGFESPTLFYQALLIHAWFARKRA